MQFNAQTVPVSDHRLPLGSYLVSLARSRPVLPSPQAVLRARGWFWVVVGLRLLAS